MAAEMAQDLSIRSRQRRFRLDSLATVALHLPSFALPVCCVIRTGAPGVLLVADAASLCEWTMSDRVDTVVIGHHPLVREGLARILPSDAYNVVAQLSELADVESLAEDPARPLLCILVAGESSACTGCLDRDAPAAATAVAGGGAGAALRSRRSRERDQGGSARLPARYDVQRRVPEIPVPHRAGRVRAPVRGAHVYPRHLDGGRRRASSGCVPRQAGAAAARSNPALLP